MTIHLPPEPTVCPDCQQTYAAIEHPLKPGVIMQLVCDCIVEMIATQPDATIATKRPLGNA